MVRTRSAAVQPEVAPAARLPPSVVTQILQQVPLQYREREKQLSLYSLVHPSWTSPAQGLLWRRVSVFSPDRADKVIASPAVGRFPTESLLLYGGKGTRKITAAQAGQLLAQSGQVENLTIRSVTGLTANSFFTAVNILPHLTQLDINMAVKDLPKGLTPILPSTPIPLKSVFLGSQSISASFLRPLFAASTATLTTLTVVLNSRTTTNLVAACPVAFPHITELNVESIRNEITHIEHKFFPVLANCTKLRSLGWEWTDFFELETAIRNLPDRGARLERMGFNLFGVRETAHVMMVLRVLGRSELGRLREVRVVGLGRHLQSDVQVSQFCRERRVQLQCW